MRNFSQNRLLASAIALAVAACSPVDTPSDNSDTDAADPEPGDPVTSLAAIEGFWLIERFEDFEPSWENNTPWRRAYVQIGPAGLTYNLGCNQSGNPASIGDDGMLKDTGDGSRMQTLMGCGEESEQRDARFFAYFGTDPVVRRLGEDRLLFESDAGELVLIDPEAWRESNVPDFDFVTQRWVPRSTLSYESWGFEGFGIGEDQGVVTIAPDGVIWSRCPESPVNITWTEDGRLRNTGGDPAPCRAVTSANRNGPRQVMDILASDPAIIRTGPQHIALVDGTAAKGKVIYLQTEESILNPPPPPPLPSGADMPPPPPAPPQLP